MDRFGLLPPVIRHNLEREQMVDRQMRSAFALYGALRALDSKLDLVFVTDRADPEYGVVPGRWHVVRHNDAPAPDSYIAITGENGEYREPDEGVLFELQQRDTWKFTDDRYLKATPGPENGPSREQIADEVAETVRAAKRLPGENLDKRRWGAK